VCVWLKLYTYTKNDFDLDHIDWLIMHRIIQQISVLSENKSVFNKDSNTQLTFYQFIKLLYKQ
jgi:hypothetical protein